MRRQVVQIVQDINTHRPRWNPLGYLDDDISKQGLEISGLPVLGSAAWLSQCPGAHVALAIGGPVARRRAVLRTTALGHCKLATLVHPAAWVGARTCVGAGTITYPGAILGTDVRVGSFVAINKTRTVGHDAVLGDLITLALGVNVGGSVTVGEGCDLGINSATIQGIAIGEWSIIGAGAVVISDLPAKVITVGVPARVIDSIPAGQMVVGIPARPLAEKR